MKEVAQAQSNRPEQAKMATVSSTMGGGSEDSPESAAVNMIVNEMLCFITKKRNSMPLHILTKMLMDCYSEQEVESAKKLYYYMNSVLVTDQMQTRYKKRIEQERKKYDIDDVMTMVMETHNYEVYAELRGQKLEQPACYDLGHL